MFTIPENWQCAAYSLLELKTVDRIQEELIMSTAIEQDLECLDAEEQFYHVSKTWMTAWRGYIH